MLIFQLRAQRRVLTAHLHIGFCVLDVVGQLVVPDGLDDPAGTPTATELSGMTVPSGTSAPAR